MFGKATEMEDRAEFGQERDVDAGTHQRSENRDSMFLQAHVRRSHGQPSTVRVRNLSSGGMMIEAPSPFVPGEVVVVELRGLGALSARIAWCAEGRAGVAFDTPVDARLARKGAPQSVLPTLLEVPVVARSKRPPVRGA